MSRYTRIRAVRDAARNLVDDHANKIWLGLAALLIATGINVAIHASWFVSILIAAVAVGGMCAPLLTFGTAAKVLTRSESRAVAELHARIRKELPR